MIAFIILLALATLTSGLRQEGAQLRLIQERRFIFERIFVPHQVTLQPQDTYYLLTKLQEIHNKSASLGIKLLHDNKVERLMINFLLDAARISEENCDPNTIEDRWLFGQHLQKFSNIPLYIEHYNQLQLDFCRWAPSGQVDNELAGEFDNSNE